MERRYRDRKSRFESRRKNKRKFTEQTGHPELEKEFEEMKQQFYSEFRADITEVSNVRIEGEDFVQDISASGVIESPFPGIDSKIETTGYFMYNPGTRIGLISLDLIFNNIKSDTMLVVRYNRDARDRWGDWLVYT